VAAVAGLLLGATPAAAHTTLVDSNPGDGATLTGPPAEVTLEFSEPVPQDFTQVAVLDADDNHYEDGAAQVVGASVTQAVHDLPAGDYRISYRVGSSDGHPVTGVLTFTVAAQDDDRAKPSQTPGQTRLLEQTQPSANTEAPAPVEQPAATDVAGGEEDSGSALRWLGAGAAVAAAAALLFGLLRRPSGGAAPPESDTGQQ
jgi:hypothetical protein